MQKISRRQFVKFSVCTAVVAALPMPKGALGATPSPVKELAFYNIHTGEKLRVAFCEHGRYIPTALHEINHLLRDYRNNDIHAIDTALLDQLHALQRHVDSSEAFHVISGYRSPQTNQSLAKHSKGVAKHSMHTEGRAIDICLPGKDLSMLHNAALRMQAGGVGYYPGSGFVHLDTGRVRHWSQTSA